MTDELVKINQNGTTLGFVNTCDVESEEGLILVYNAVNNAESLNNVPEGTVLDVAEVIQKPGIRRSRDPRIPDVQCVDTYLVTDDGTAYMSQSSGIAKSAEFLANMFFAKADRAASYPMVVTLRHLPNGNTVKGLQIVR